MEIIKWKDCYKTNIQVFDQEHQTLVAQINLLYQAIRQKKTEAVLKQIFDQLLKYTTEHFAHEERLLAKYNYPDLAEHQAAHQDLRDRVKQLQEQATDDSATLASDLLKFLRGWLLEHIVAVDKSYGVFLESRAGRFVD